MSFLLLAKLDFWVPLRPIVAKLRQCSQQLACREPVIQQDRRKLCILKLDDHIDRLVVADSSHHTLAS